MNTRLHALDDVARFPAREWVSLGQSLAGAPRLTPGDYRVDGTIDLREDASDPHTAPVDPLPQNGPAYSRFRTRGAL
jgi:hypothetical protein